MSVSKNGLAPIEIVEDEAQVVEHRAQLVRFQKNVDWLQAHAAEVYRTHRGKCICVAGQELFVADTAATVIALAQRAHPEDDGQFVHYIPLEKVPRIYAH